MGTGHRIPQARVHDRSQVHRPRSPGRSVRTATPCMRAGSTRATCDDTKDHLRVMKSTDRGTSWGPAFDMSGPMDLDGGAEDPDEMQVFTFVGDVVYTLSFERIDADNRKLVVRKSRDGGASVETSSVVTTSKRSPAYPNVQRPKMVVDGGERLRSHRSRGLGEFDAGVVVQEHRRRGHLRAAQPWSRRARGTAWAPIGNAQFCVEGDERLRHLQLRQHQPLRTARMRRWRWSHDGGATFSPPETRLHERLPSERGCRGRPRVRRGLRIGRWQTA